MTTTIFKRIAGFFLACCMALFMVSGAHAGLIGQELAVAYARPDVNTALEDSFISPSQFTVEDGSSVAGGTDFSSDYPTFFFLYFTDTAISISFLTDAVQATFAGSPFDGILLTNVSGTPWGLTLASITSTLTGLPEVSFVGDQLRINFSGLSVSSDSTIDIQFNTGGSVAIPEPPVWSLLLALLLSLPLKLQLKVNRKAKQSML